MRSTRIGWFVVLAVVPCVPGCPVIVQPPRPSGAQKPPPPPPARGPQDGIRPPGDRGDPGAPVPGDRGDPGAPAGGSLGALSLGTLTQTVMGETAGGGNNLDGTNTGIGGGDEFNWSGPDHVYEWLWTGGGIHIELLFIHDDGDLDLIVWADEQATVQVGSGTGGSDTETIGFENLAAGTYWIVVDGWRGASNTYELRLIP